MDYETPTFRSVPIESIHNVHVLDPPTTSKHSALQPAASAAPLSKFKYQVSGGTDVGGARENQDEYFILELPDALVIGVLDGHGRDVGKTAAVAAKDSLKLFFQENENCILADPYKCMVQAFARAHVAVRNAFHQQLSEAGWEVEQVEQGYLLRRKRDMQPWLCVHGGTSCSIIAIVGTTMIIANVGDSSAVMCASHQCLNESAIKLIGDSGFDLPLVQREMLSTHKVEEGKMQIEEDVAFSLPFDSPCMRVLNWGPAGGEPINGIESTSQDKRVLVLTGDHSPENPSEFERLRQFWPSEESTLQPQLLVVYDAPTHDKTRCNGVFQLDETGKPSATGRGRYYKNVRREWASLVATPPSARYQDALAFTRSIGDFHLHTYGVSHLPEVRCVDLAPLSQRTDDPSQSSATPLLSILLATDGVWDNWTYEDVATFLLDPSCTSAVMQDSQGARRVLQSFMSRNAAFARRNFGSQADNASGVLVYLSADPTLPV